MDWKVQGQSETPMANRSKDVAGLSSEDLLSANATPAAAWGGERALLRELKDSSYQLALAQSELAQERKARVSAEACGKVLMHDAMLLRSQAVQAGQELECRDQNWRAAVSALEVNLADRGFEGFGFERKQMQEEITRLKSALDKQDRESWRLKGENEGLEEQLSTCKKDFEREKGNARRLAAIAAEREVDRESAAKFAVLNRTHSPHPEETSIVAAQENYDADTAEIRFENHRLKSHIQSMKKTEQTFPTLEKSDHVVKLEHEIARLTETLSAKVVQESRAAAERTEVENKAALIVEMKQEIKVLEEALRKQSKNSVTIQQENENNVVKLNALQQAFAEALRGNENYETTVRALKAQIAVLEGRVVVETERRLSSVVTQVESIASALESSKWRVWDLWQDHTELERKMTQQLQVVSQSSLKNEQQQMRFQELQRRHGILEADWNDKEVQISGLKDHLGSANCKTQEQTTEIQQLQTSVKRLNAQLVSANGHAELTSMKLAAVMKETTNRQMAAHERIEAHIDSLMDSVDILDIYVGTGLPSACSKLKTRAVYAEVQGRWQREKLDAVIQYQKGIGAVEQSKLAELETKVYKLGQDNVDLSERLRVATVDVHQKEQLQKECSQLKQGLNTFGKHTDDLQSTTQVVELLVAQLCHETLRRCQDEQYTASTWKTKYETQRNEEVLAMVQLQTIITEQELALDSLSQVILKVSLDALARSKQHAAKMSEQSLEIEFLRRASTEAQAATAVATKKAEQAEAKKAEDEPKIAKLELKLHDAMLIVESAAAFKENLQEQAQRIALARDADGNALARYAKRIQTLETSVRMLESEVEESCAMESMQEEVLLRLLEVTEQIQRSVKIAVMHSASAKGDSESEIALLRKVGKDKEKEYTKQAAQNEMHVEALRQLQQQHERLLAELEGREKLIGMMEEQQVVLHAQMLRLEHENRELGFFMQGHSIVQNIEQIHLEQAISKANEASHVLVAAKSQELRFQQHYHQCARQAADTQACISKMEKAVLQLGQQLEETLVSANDLLKYRNLCAHAKKPLFVPTTRSGAELSMVMSKNVCFLLENAGVPLLARGRAAQQELGIFFAEQFDSWMQEIMKLSSQKEACKAALDDMRAELLSAQDRICGLQPSLSTCMFIPTHSRCQCVLCFICMLL